MASRLHQLSALGQSVWIDFLSRDLLESGGLARAIAEDAVVGVTSNPTIFAKALSGGDAYDDQIALSDGDANASSPSSTRFRKVALPVTRTTGAVRRCSFPLRNGDGARFPDSR